MNDLQIISELRGVLADADTRTWELVESLEYSLERDPRYSDQERAAVQHLRSAISDLIAAKRAGLNPHTSNASVALTSIESSLLKRTTGLDGWPLR